MLLPIFYIWIVLATVTWYLRPYLRLRHIPGPFWAKFSNLPRLLWVAGGKAHDVHIAQHRKYGDLVQIGPNVVSVTDPDEIPKIYDFAGKYLKVGQSCFQCAIYFKEEKVSNITGVRDGKITGR
jgi:hypothetical protein